MFGLEMAVLRAGTPLFHGTRCAGDYGIPDGPAWFAYTRGSAAKWIDWSARLPEGRHPGERRVLQASLGSPTSALGWRSRTRTSTMRFSRTDSTRNSKPSTSILSPRLGRRPRSLKTSPPIEL